ncbi:19244_t:CDS:2, partial [Funneliformis geosporum]
MFSEASKAWSSSRIVSGFFPFSFEELSTEEIGSVFISTCGDTLFNVDDSCSDNCLFATGDLEQSHWLNGIIGDLERSRTIDSFLALGDIWLS